MVVKCKKAFSLIAIIIVIAIIAIFLLLGFFNYFSVNRKTRDTKRKADLKNLKIALISYNTEKNHHPSETEYENECDY